MNDLFITKSTVDYGTVAGIWAIDTLPEGALQLVDGDGKLLSNGVLQVETATVVGTVTTAGNATVIVTSALVTGSPLTVTVALALNDTPAMVATKFRDALNSTSAITKHYTVSGSVATVVLTTKVKAANDATLNMAIANGTAAGLTAAATSANTTAGVAFTADKIQVVLGTAEGTPKMSVPLFRSGFSYKKQAYVAPVAAVKFIGSDTAAAAGSYSLNLPAITVGASVSIGIRDLTKPTEDTGAVRYYSITTGVSDVLTGLTTANPIVRLIAAINADALAVVVAVANNDGAGNLDGIKLTAKVAGEDFAPFVLTGILQSADVVEYKMVNKLYVSGSVLAVTNNVGQGSLAAITKLEKDLAVADGYMGREAASYWYTVAPKAAAGGTYTVYTLVSKYPLSGKVGEPATYSTMVYIAVPSGETGAGEVITVLDSLLAEFTA